MELKILVESGFLPAIYGLGLSYGVTSEVSWEEFVERIDLQNKMHRVSLRLKDLNLGHNKFLESIGITFEIRAPRFFYQQFDAYRTGITKQSESTEHLILKRTLKFSDFKGSLHPAVLEVVNSFIIAGDIEKAKDHLPESFLQKRVVATNYRTIYNMVTQRANHRMSEWKDFCDFFLKNAEHAEYFKR